MSRFVQADLAALGDVPAVEDVDFETIRARRGEYLKAALTAFGVDFDVTALETSPLMVAVARGGGYEETLFRQVINEKIRALSLATATGGDQDHIAATYYGISRQSDIDAEGNVVLEDDVRFRERIALAPEAFSTAGPLGAYVFHVLELDGVQDIADAWAYSEEDGAKYTAGLYAGVTPYMTGVDVLAPEVLIIILPTSAYVAENGGTDQALLERAYVAVQADDVRPLGDKVTIEPAQIVNYTVDMTITYARGADPTPLVNEARRRIAAYTAGRRRVGVKAERLGIGGCGYVSGIEAVTLNSPLADVAGGPKQAPNCTSITVTAVQAEGTWT